MALPRRQRAGRQRSLGGSRRVSARSSGWSCPTYPRARPSRSSPSWSSRTTRTLNPVSQGCPSASSIVPQRDVDRRLGRHRRRPARLRRRGHRRPMYTGEKLVTRRSVTWKNPRDPVARSELLRRRRRPARAAHAQRPNPACRRIRGQGGLEDITRPRFRTSSCGSRPALAEKLLLPLPWLLETVDLLNEKRQIVALRSAGHRQDLTSPRSFARPRRDGRRRVRAGAVPPVVRLRGLLRGAPARLQQDGRGRVASTSCTDRCAAWPRAPPRTRRRRTS